MERSRKARVEEAAGPLHHGALPRGLQAEIAKRAGRAARGDPSEGPGIMSLTPRLITGGGVSTLYLGTDADSLAEEVARGVESTVRAGNPFTGISVVVPNRYLGKWLRLWLARRLGVIVNVRFTYLEHALWDLLCRLDDRTAPIKKLDDLPLRFMILSLLLGPATESEGAADTEPRSEGVGRDPLGPLR